MIRLFCAAICVLLCACASEQPRRSDMPPEPTPAEKPQDVVWGFGQQAITLKIIAKPDLNSVRDVSHALEICVMQAKNREAFFPAAADPQGITELLQCKADGQNIVSAKRIHVQPGQQMTVHLDRMEGARFLAAAAGFNDLIPEDCFSVVSIPLHEITGRNWHFGLNRSYSVANMDAWLFLSDRKLHLEGAERVF
ncbi:MAG: type VI secretion system lipoprotein TssJ [Desulfovibrionaceae bacterium]|nr:type VI secretion system lipoprotein TssJ [Desulfovibrionaceae bacterium]